MSNMKYLADGRKVVVIGKINQTEHIVQEIFVTDSGDELPSGDNLQPRHCWMSQLRVGKTEI